jgi:hypothetical protein
MNFDLTFPPSLVYPPRPPHYHGFCWGCCRPAESCCCAIPQCRREAKELLAESTATKTTATSGIQIIDKSESIDEKAIVTNPTTGTTGTTAITSNLRTKAVTTHAFIGGGCCVHLSVEYMPVSALEVSTDGKTINSSTAASVQVKVTDSEGTVLTWSQTTGANSVYQVRENIITTKPGARVELKVENMVARVRWCEVYSC